MWVAPIRSGIVDKKINDYEDAMDDWYNFTNETKLKYGVDMSVLKKSFAEEQRKYYLQVTSLFLYHLNFFFLRFIRDKLTSNSFLNSSGAVQL